MSGALGIIAGGGGVPLRLAAGAARAGRPVFVLALEGFADPADYAGHPHEVVRIGAAGRILERLRAHGCRQVVLSGAVKRPSFLALRPDAGAVGLIARIGRAAMGGDDTLLSAVVRILGEEGFEVVASQDVLKDLLSVPGPVGALVPDAPATADIRRGIEVQRALAAADVGQAVVVQQGLVLGLEGVEGTDALLERVGPLRREGPGGVLVKLLKPGQSRIVDLPTVGVTTVRGAAAAGLRGIAIEAGGTILVDRAAVAAAADAAGLFVVAIEPDRFPAQEPAAGA
ncbi:UDP-2,3-diacylglucosamine diphosphatase LpxI [Roseomonas sp. NAR14]|uniref:UDP-2,3-diacylglucosamine diphosphatase LpxI n=1 Tax=Roseomonas acroporae TaxID=2937791 RepID=A0A9X1YJ84_9PROT|nr:UDP-2,3-diacylglucosamine diphosphatase LpxI [Roseomonas acroporae]MCK8787141.1 UDP-2,3-diacylglucosamine diphosphatase LpxI [Roseomonas acroporae]